MGAAVGAGAFVLLVLVTLASAAAIAPALYSALGLGKVNGPWGSLPLLPRRSRSFRAPRRQVTARQRQTRPSNPRGHSPTQVKILELWSIILPIRIANEDLADFSESVVRHQRQGKTIRAWALTVSAVFWTGLNAIGHAYSMFRKRSGA